MPVSPGCFCAYVFFLLLLFPPSALRIRRVMQSSITVTPFPGSGFRRWQAPALRGLPALHGLLPSCPSLASWPLPFAGFPPGLGRTSCPSRAPCPSRARCPLRAFLVSFEWFAPCSEFSSLVRLVWLLVLKVSTLSSGLLRFLSLSRGLLLCSKISSLCRALFSNSIL